MAALAVAPLAASAHPSDFQTLTIDLLFGVEGLDAIDAAVVEASGPSYQPFPSAELRQRVAEDVLIAMGLSESSSTIDAELSERYHEVGFLVTFAQPAPGGESLQIDTGPLQQIAKDANLTKLKLSVCSESSEIFSKLEIDASTPGREPIDSKAERAWCAVWELAVDDAPVTVTVAALVLPITGTSTHGAVTAAITLLAVGSVILGGRRR